MLNLEAIKQYQELHKKYFGEEISEDEARTMGTRLVELFKIVYSQPCLNEKIQG